MKKSFSPLDLKIFGWIGFAVMCLAILVLPVLLGHLITWNRTPIQMSTTTSLGERGSVCGGPERLPCGAGLICAHEINSDAPAGICEPAPEAATSTDSVSQSKNGLSASGESCAVYSTLGHVCEPALVCNEGVPGLPVCGEATTSSPRILSVKLDGAQLNEGVYRVIVGTKTTVTIQAVNAKSVQSNFGNLNEGQTLFKQGKGGLYTQDLVFPAYANELTLSAEGKDGTWSGLVMKVATVQAVR